MCSSIFHFPQFDTSQCKKFKISMSAHNFVDVGGDVHVYNTDTHDATVCSYARVTLNSVEYLAVFYKDKLYLFPLMFVSEQEQPRGW